MGCQACRASDQEKSSECQFPDDNKIVAGPKVLRSAQPKGNYDQFIKNFEKNLPYIGKYLEVNDFNGLIPETALKVMTEKTLETTRYANKDISTYDVKPVEFPNGNIYWGNWNDKLEMEGNGKYYLKDDKVLAEGFWEGGELKFARVFMPNNDVYEGEICNSTFNGKGKLISAEETYEGEFVDGEKTGSGTITYNDGTEYSGQINNGVFMGKGRMKWPNGIEYEGGFSGPTLSGYGTLTNNQGEKYEGNFEKNLFNGQGKYSYNNGENYEGNFEYGIKKGKGTYSFTDGYSYIGDWDNDVPYGFGKIYNGGSVMKSTWRNGKMIDAPTYEVGTENDFNGFNFDFNPKEMTLNANGLPHLESQDLMTSQYKPGALPSFLNE